jgi:hypothetical protein
MMRGAAADAHCSYYRLLAMIVLLLVAFAVQHAASQGHSPYAKVFRAEIAAIPGTDSDVTGFAYVFASGDGSTIGYVGQLFGLEPGIFAPKCMGTENGCGVHVHTGYSCETVDGQGGHYFESPPVQEDPWVHDSYSSNARGHAKFSGIVDIGTDDLSGRSFLSKSLLIVCFRMF